MKRGRTESNSTTDYNSSQLSPPKSLSSPSNKKIKTGHNTTPISSILSSQNEGSDYLDDEELGSSAPQIQNRQDEENSVSESSEKSNTYNIKKAVQNIRTNHEQNQDEPFEFESPLSSQTFDEEPSVKVPQKSQHHHHHTNHHHPQQSKKTTTYGTGPSKKITKEDIERAEKMVKLEREKWKAAFSSENDESFKQLSVIFNDLHTLKQRVQQYEIHKLPEIVVVGMQSDGKSSFVEALLGFQFNTIDTQIGTRRPLMLQMQNDLKYDKPCCYFMNEDDGLFSETATPVFEIENEIRRRTEAVCGRDGVSAKVIGIKVLYKYCSNLTIYDTPGFRKGALNDPLSDKIYKMNTIFMQEPNKLIVCLEQSTVEWCNTQMRPIIRQVDPNFERTIFVTTKFNNRVNQFKNREEIDGYLSTDGQIPILDRVFFISLPSGIEARDLTSDEFKEKILETYLDDYKMLCKIGFDEKKFKNQLGFLNLKKHLESELYRKYKHAIYPVSQRLQGSIDKRKTLIDKLHKEILQMESENVEESVTKIVGAYISNVHSALQGTTLFDPLQNGQTLEEEKTASGLKDWPNYCLSLTIRNSKYKLYGGSQLERLLAEFEVVAHAQEFPPTTDDEVAVTIGLNSLHNTPDYDRGASDLAQRKCRTIFQPLIEILMKRSKFVMHRMFEIVTQYMATSLENGGKYKGLFDELRKVSELFVDKVLVDVRGKTNEEFDTFTKIIDWDLISYGTKQSTDYDVLNPTEEATIQRVSEQTQVKLEGVYADFNKERSRELTEERCKTIKIVAAKLFGGVRLLFVKYIRAKYNAFFLNPVFTEFDQYLRNYFTQLGSDNLKALVGLQIAATKQRILKLTDAMLKLEDVNKKVVLLMEQFAALEKSAGNK